MLQLWRSGFYEVLIKISPDPSSFSFMFNVYVITVQNGGIVILFKVMILCKVNILQAFEETSFSNGSITNDN